MAQKKTKKKTRLEIVQERAQQAVNKTNKKIDELGENTNILYQNLFDIQILFDKIRNIPSDKKIEYEKYKKIRLNWKEEANKIEKEFNNTISKNAGRGAAGVGVGVAVVTLGPTAAMGIATTFGVASTGTAIASLSGAAATNAALAWLGGGAIAAGGGGMAAGNALLLMAGPIGWSIAAAAMATSVFFIRKAKDEQRRLEDIFTLVGKRDIKSYDLATVELNERIKRMIDENQKIKVAIEDIKTFGIDYERMTEKEQYALGAYVNLMSSTTQLLINPILGLRPKYDKNDLEKFLREKKLVENDNIKDLIIAIANLLYSIQVDEKDLVALYKSLKNNADFLTSFKIKKSEFKLLYVMLAYSALQYKADV